MILVPISGCICYFLYESLKFRHEVGLKIKNATGKCCSEWPIEHENAKKKGGGGEPPPPPGRNVGKIPWAGKG